MKLYLSGRVLFVGLALLGGILVLFFFRGGNVSRSFGNRSSDALIDEESRTSDGDSAPTVTNGVTDPSEPRVFARAEFQSPCEA